MKLRNVERSTVFSKEVETYCNIHNLQGLSRTDNGYKLAFEAIDIENDRVADFKLVLPENEIFLKTLFANKIGCDFAVFLHKARPNDEFVSVGTYRLNESEDQPVVIEKHKYTVPEFIDWWKTIREGRQTKGYRPHMREALQNSYFDSLFADNESSWATNVDGFIVSTDENGKAKIAGVVENRFSTNGNLEDYDPNNYYQPSAYNGGDHQTWDVLKDLRDRLNVPLFLFTYSRKEGYEHKVGITIVNEINHETGLHYLEDIKPGDNIFANVEDANTFIVSKI